MKVKFACSMAGIAGMAVGLALASTVTLASAETLDGVTAVEEGKHMSVADYVLSLRARAAAVSTEGNDIRIFGGKPAKEGAWPAQVSLHMADKIVDGDRKSWFDSQICGGSVISRDWVMTAAHCVFDEEDNLRKPESLMVHSGSVDLREGDMRAVSKVIAHEKYDGVHFENDIALLRLKDPITESSGPIGQVTIPVQDAALEEGPAVVIGWGMMEDGKFPYQLLETDIRIESNDTCNAGMNEQSRQEMAGVLLSMGKTHEIPMDNLEEAFKILTAKLATPLTEHMICAGTPHGKRTMCNGDSGGGMLVRNDEGNWIQQGIVSWNRAPIGSDNPCGHEGLYAVYTRVSAYHDWIADHIRETAE